MTKSIRTRAAIFTAILTAITPAIVPMVAMADSADSTVEIDTNGDGLLTIQELQAVYPDLTAETFSAVDTNNDGALDDAEMVAAQEAGHMTSPSGT